MKMRSAIPAFFLLLAGCATSSDEKAPPHFGWFEELAGACWQGRDSAGAPSDTQCYAETDGVIRGTIAIGETFEGDSVIGISADRKIEMLFWSNGAPRGVFDLYYEGDALIFADRNSAGRTRNLWRRESHDAFNVTPQTFSDGAWRDGDTYLYTRVRNAPAPYEVEASGPGDRQPVEGYGFLGSLAKGCWAGGGEKSGDRQCYSAQYGSILHASAKARSGETSHSGRAVYLPADDRGEIAYAWWTGDGRFGIASARIEDDEIVLGGEGGVRTVWSPVGEGFAVRRERAADGSWIVEAVTAYSRAPDGR